MSIFYNKKSEKETKKDPIATKLLQQKIIMITKIYKSKKDFLKVIRIWCEKKI